MTSIQHYLEYARHRSSVPSRVRTRSGLNTSISISLLLIPAQAFAAQTGVYAWEVMLSKVVHSLTGPVAYALSIIAVVLGGCVMAFADLQGGAKALLQAACGLSVVFFATQIVTGFLGFSGAVI